MYVHTFEEAEVAASRLNLPSNMYVEVLGSHPPKMLAKDGPRVIYMSEAAKSVSFKIDPKARRVIVYPSGVVHTEY